MESMDAIRTLVEKSRQAQKEYERFGQHEVDEIVKAIAKTVYDNAEILARMAVEETRMGVYEDKVKKCRGKASIIWNSLKGKKSVGIIARDEETGVVEVAKPMGVVAAVTPCTNPIVTPMCNAMFALKGRNSIIFAPHPRAKKETAYLTGLFLEAIHKYNVPENLIQFMQDPTPEATGLLMKTADVVVATGGMGMVKAAYSSGKPAYGVGAGNVQCIVDKESCIEEAVPKIVAGRIFDNGIICSGEQSVIVQKDIYDQVIGLFRKNGVYYTEDPGEVAALRNALFANGMMNKSMVGQSVRKVAQASGIQIPEGSKAILVQSAGSGALDDLNKEKMCPVFAAFRYGEFREAVEIANANLDVAGKGHSVSIHSNNREHIEYAANHIPVCRVLVNQVCSTMNGGSFFNGFSPTTTLGCGSWGNNSISENLNYRHLINITRIGYYMKNNRQPTDEELWV